METTYSCRKACGNFFIRKDNRDRHEKRKSGCKGTKEIEVENNAEVASKSEFACTKRWCKKVFKSKFNKDRHEETCYDKSNQNTCFICKQVFKRQTHFRRHMATHSMPKQRFMRCSKCKKGFKRKDLRNIHQEQCQATQHKAARKKSAGLVDVETEPDYDFMSFIESVIPNLPEGNQEVPGNETQFTQIENRSNSTACEDEEISFFLEPPQISHQELLSDCQESDRDILMDDVVCDFYNPPVYVIPDESECIVSDASESCTSESDSPVIGTEDVAAELDHHMTMVEASVVYLLQQLHLSKRSIKKRIATAKHIKDVFSEKLKDEDFMEYLSRQLKFDNVTSFSDFLTWSEKDYSFVRGRRDHKINITTAEKVVEFWKKHMVISVDRRNNRHQARISKKKCHPTYLQVKDDEVTVMLEDDGVTETGKLQAHRYIYTKSFRKLYKSFLKENPTNFVSHGIFHRLKPFYIGKPTENEKQSCLCIKCQNAHGLYEPLKRNDPSLPESLTEYLTRTIKCEKDDRLAFVKLQCINSECDNKCKLSVSTDSNFSDETLKKYYTFDRVPTYYYNKKGKKVTYIRTTRVDKQATLKELYSMLKETAVNYLQHRYSAVSDHVFWTHMNEVMLQPYIHLDYSQNIALKPKHETQSMHFSGKEQTLHCTVLVYPEKNHFVYHLSNDTIHDSIMTSSILRSIVTEHPELIETGKLVIKSDNCSTQYKSRKVFEAVKKLANEWDCEIYWFYGEAGHGRGLVDAMSSFGCKKVLNDAIVCEDVWFKDATEMLSYLQNEMLNDSTKEYLLIDEAETAAKRRRKVKELKREGCMKFCLMAVNQLGQWMVREVLDVEDENITNFVFDDPEDCYDTNDIEYTEYNDEGDKLDELKAVADELVLPIVYEVVSPGDFVALRSDTASLEQFYIVQVLSKGVADDYINDGQGHFISKGQPYFTVKYLEKSEKSTKKIIKYTQSKTDPALVGVAEIFATNIEMASDLTMHVSEYQSLVCSLFR